MTTELANDVTGPPPVGISAWLGRIVCGDNTEVLSGFPAECVDLVVTSPPYDDLRTYGGHSWNFETLAAQLVRVLKPGGVIVWVVADATVNGSETGTSLRQALHFKDVCGLRLHDTMAYLTNKPPLTHNRYEQAWEYMFVLSKGTPKAWNPLKEPSKYAGQKRCATMRQDGDELNGRSAKGAVQDDRLLTNAWYLPRSSKTDDAIRAEHPATFPDDLARRHIVSWSNPGDVVLDPFSGSGTTCKCAKELNRNFVGIEVEPKYCAIAEARLSQDVLQLETCAMRPNAAGEPPATKTQQ